MGKKWGVFLWLRVGELRPPGVLTLFTRLILNFWMVFGAENDSANGSMIWNYYYVGMFLHFWNRSFFIDFLTALLCAVVFS